LSRRLGIFWQQTNPVLFTYPTAVANAALR
jgi:hypothetical protein